MKIYQVTKEACQAQIDKVENGICPGCGGKVEPLETVNNSGEPTFWSGCNHCSVFTYPVDRLVFEIADYAVRNGDIVRYERKPYNATPEEEASWLDTERRGVVSYVQSVLSIKKMLEAKS